MNEYQIPIFDKGLKIRIWRTGEIFSSRRSILQINNLAFYASVIRLTIIAVNLNVGVYSI